MAEWTRNLAGVLTVGVGLEQALVATLRSAPQPIRPEVSRLVARLRARWTTEDALQEFADELDDATGDLVAAYLILGARRRGTGLASVLQGLAESVADDVAARRQIEADRAKPRATARNVTLITLAVLGPARVRRPVHGPLRHPPRPGPPGGAAGRLHRNPGVDAPHVAWANRCPASSPPRRQRCPAAGAEVAS